jgi:type IX secretion system PorP/SprF family membrane protein
LNPEGIPDPVYQHDIELMFLPNLGLGMFYYSDKYYISLSIPRIAEINNLNYYGNYSAFMHERSAYLSGGVVFNVSPDLVFKPVVLLRAATDASIRMDLSANFLLKEKLWLGAMYRTNDAVCFVGQWDIRQFHPNWLCHGRYVYRPVPAAIGNTRIFFQLLHRME